MGRQAASSRRVKLFCLVSGCCFFLRLGIELAINVQQRPGSDAVSNEEFQAAVSCQLLADLVLALAVLGLFCSCRKSRSQSKSSTKQQYTGSSVGIKTTVEPAPKLSRGFSAVVTSPSNQSDASRSGPRRPGSAAIVFPEVLGKKKPLECIVDELKQDKAPRDSAEVSAVNNAAAPCGSPVSSTKRYQRQQNNVGLPSAKKNLRSRIFGLGDSHTIRPSNSSSNNSSHRENRQSNGSGRVSLFSIKTGRKSTGE